MTETPTKTKSPWLTTTELAELYGVNRDTVRDWIIDGIDSPAGRIRLYARRIGGNWKSTTEYAEKFFDALEGSRDAAPVAETPAAKADRARKAQERVRKKLSQKAG